jgi:hypothetical protein
MHADVGMLNVPTGDAVTFTCAVVGGETHPLLFTTSETLYIPELPYETDIGPAPDPVITFPPPKFQLNVAVEGPFPV